MDAETLAAAALLTLAQNPTDPRLVGISSTYLQEALGLTQDPTDRANLLANLSAIYLHWGELLQSPTEVVTGLELALEALELEPSSSQAAFNRDLAWVQLGLAPQEIEESLVSAPDPWRAELEVHWAKAIDAQPVGVMCPAPHEWRTLFDDWSRGNNQLKSLELSLLEDQMRCLKNSEDRYFVDLARASKSDPVRTGNAWLKFRAAEQAAYGFDLKIAERRLSELKSVFIPKPLLLGSEWLEAFTAYQGADYSRSRRLLKELAEAAAIEHYFELAANSHRFLALIDQIVGDYSNSMDQASRALRFAEQTSSPSVIAATRTLLFELEEVTGQHERAWLSIVHALKGFHGPTQHGPKILALQSASRLASEQHHYRVARAFHDRDLELARDLGPVVLATSLRQRGEHFAKIGDLERGRGDLEAARKLLSPLDLGGPFGEELKADLLFLEGKVSTSNSVRRQALEAALTQYRSSHYRRHLVELGSILAKAQRTEGNLQAALATLEAAIEDLAQQATTVHWSEAAALVRAARPVIEEQLEILVQVGDSQDLLEATTTYFSLRSRSTARNSKNPVKEFSSQQVTYFVSEDQLFILVRHEDSIVNSAVVEVSAEKLAELKKRLAVQLRTRTEVSRIHATTTHCCPVNSEAKSEL